MKRFFFKEFRFSKKGGHLWSQVTKLNAIAKNLCTTHDLSWCFNETCCCKTYKHLPFQCDYNGNKILASYNKGDYDFDNFEEIEEFVAFKGAHEISSLLEHADDVPYKSESLAILKYCFENYNDNHYITEFLNSLSPKKGETDALQEPVEIAETENYLDEKEEESNEQREEEHSCLPFNESNS